MYKAAWDYAKFSFGAQDLLNNVLLTDIALPGMDLLLWSGVDLKSNQGLAY